MGPNNLYIKSMALRGLPEFIQDLGGSPKDLFTKADLKITHIESDNFYNWVKACRLLELAATELNEPSLGIKWAHRIPMDFLNSGPMLLLAALTPTMRDFFNLGIKYQKLHVNGVHYSYSDTQIDNELECLIQIHPLSPPCRQFCEHIMATLFLIERNLFNKAELTKITFQHNAPTDLTWHEKTFECPIIFNSDKTAGYLKSDYLDEKIGNLLQPFQPILRLYLQRRLKNNSHYENSISATVTEILPTIFGMNISSINQVTKVLELNPRKLQRLLKEEGTTYSKLLDKVRKNTCERLLFESDISITHLANLLDYASNESFNAACKRWFGYSPRKYRQHLRSSMS